MTLIAIVTYTVTPYMESTGKEKINYHTVEAESEEEAIIKIQKYYFDVKSSDYGDCYNVIDINFFQHIK